jgi:hypothetical protein
MRCESRHLPNSGSDHTACHKWIGMIRATLIKWLLVVHKVTDTNSLAGPSPGEERNQPPNRRGVGLRGIEM